MISLFYFFTHICIPIKPPQFYVQAQNCISYRIMQFRDIRITPRFALSQSYVHSEIVVLTAFVLLFPSCPLCHFITTVLCASTKLHFLSHYASSRYTDYSALRALAILRPFGNRRTHCVRTPFSLMSVMSFHNHSFPCKHENCGYS